MNQTHMNEKQLNENLGISKSLNIHTASLDSFFFFHSQKDFIYLFLFYFIFKLYRFIFNHSYFYCQQFIKDICICIFSFCHSNLNSSYIYIYIYTYHIHKYMLIQYTVFFPLNLQSFSYVLFFLQGWFFQLVTMGVILFPSLKHCFYGNREIRSFFNIN